MSQTYWPTGIRQVSHETTIYFDGRNPTQVPLHTNDCEIVLSFITHPLAGSDGSVGSMGGGRILLFFANEQTDIL